jgi:hypothetical protein
LIFTDVVLLLIRRFEIATNMFVLCAQPSVKPLLDTQLAVAFQFVRGSPLQSRHEAQRELVDLDRTGTQFGRRC